MIIFCFVLKKMLIVICEKTNFQIDPVSQI